MSTPMRTTFGNITNFRAASSRDHLLSPNALTDDCTGATFIIDRIGVPGDTDDPLLERLLLTVTSLSFKPVSGNEVVEYVRTKTNDVITRFIPCINCFVNCQQELRKGLAVAKETGMTPFEFHNMYVIPSIQRFNEENEILMTPEHLRQASASLNLLVKDAAAAIPQSCDRVKNAFLGGMRENKSWGLRKWVSDHGGAGSICDGIEEVMRRVKALRKEDETTKRLIKKLRSLARDAYAQLKKDVPASYQKQSTAHPYLPFYHRIESCLNDMASYDPEEEDDVICLPVAKLRHEIIMVDDTDDEICNAITPSVKPPKLNEMLTADKPAPYSLPTALPDTTRVENKRKHVETVTVTRHGYYYDQSRKIQPPQPYYPPIRLIEYICQPAPTRKTKPRLPKPRLPATGMKKCMACTKELPRECFSKHQWRGKACKRRCTECVTNNKRIVQTSEVAELAPKPL